MASKKVKKKADIKDVTRDSEWLAGQNLSEYDGQWIAVADEAIVARDRSLEKVMKTIEGLDLARMPLYLRVSMGAVF